MTTPTRRQLLVLLLWASACSERHGPLETLRLAPPWAARSHATGEEVAPGRGWTAESARGEGVTISVHATNVVHAPRAAAPLPTQRVRAVLGRTFTAEGIRVVEWTEDDVAYALEVECERIDDARCVRGDFALGVAAAMTSDGAAQ